MIGKLLGIQKPVVLAPMGFVTGGALAAEESLVAREAKQRVVDANGDATLRTTVFDIIRGYDWPDGITARALRNSFTGKWHGNEEALKKNLPQEKKAYADAVEQRNFDTALVFAGEGIDLVDAVLPAAEIVKRIAP